MPKKGSKKKAKKPKMIGNETPAQIVKRLLRTYDRNCAESNTLLCPSLKRTMKDFIENENLLCKFVVDCQPEQKCIEDPVVTLEPLMMAIRQEKYSFIKSLHVWNVPIISHHITSLACLLEKGLYPITKIELIDCLVDAPSAQRLASAFQYCSTLSTVCLDHNDIGDEGCFGICEGMEGNKSITSLSLNYCGLGIDSGRTLGHVITNTALRELYIDGNDLQCEGIIDLVCMTADFEHAEAALREQERLEKEERERMMAEDGQSGLSGAESNKSGEGKKKKKKKKKKTKEPPKPPEVAKWFQKLHFADNGVDMLAGQDRSVLIQCVGLLALIVTCSKNIQEIDIDDNLIGDVGGQLFLKALEHRAEEKLPGMKLRTTHRMAADTFNSIVKLGAGLKKKKGKKGKKKKK